ncbi:MAG: hypothetical protein RIA69_10245 [Cyclobacteriaceae bacterium]
MFDGPDFPKSLNEELFEAWLEKGRDQQMGYKYLLIVWDSLDEDYKPVYVEKRSSISLYDDYSGAVSQESLVAAYDLYSESRIMPRRV